ncbi:hypothetical protein [Leisingera daeponensis]|uniref:hypothetical protein n=1 Tax=Leisingera daeponensis TaxID=405746 RepID=UPI001C949333|nr:hypothetical protein [Leisingera daeponensis]MBY6054957.1 hypothetical protein [Leisingera daeponensis]
MSNIEELLPHLCEDDRANFMKAVDAIGKAFAARTSIEADPQLIANLPQVREHVLTGGEIVLDLSAALDALAGDPSISNQLIAAEVKAAEVSKIKEDTANMSRAAKMNYARERGLDRPRDDVASTMTINEHAAVLAGLSPVQRMVYARRHGLV